MRKSWIAYSIFIIIVIANIGLQTFVEDQDIKKIGGICVLSYFAVMMQIIRKMDQKQNKTKFDHNPSSPEQGFWVFLIPSYVVVHYSLSGKLFGIGPFALVITYLIYTNVMYLLNRETNDPN